MNLKKIMKARVIYPQTPNDEHDLIGNMLYCKIHGTYRENDGTEPCWGCENVRIKDIEAEIDWPDEEEAS